MNKILKKMNNDIDYYYIDQKSQIKQQHTFIQKKQLQIKPIFIFITISFLLVLNLYQYQKELNNAITKSNTGNKETEKYSQINKNSTSPAKGTIIYDTRPAYLRNAVILGGIDIIVLYYIYKTKK